MTICMPSSPLTVVCSPYPRWVTDSWNFSSLITLQGAYLGYPSVLRCMFRLNLLSAQSHFLLKTSRSSCPMTMVQFPLSLSVLFVSYLVSCRFRTSASYLQRGHLLVTIVGYSTANSFSETDTYQAAVVTLRCNSATASSRSRRWSSGVMFLASTLAERIAANSTARS